MKKSLLIVGIVSALLIGFIGYETATKMNKVTDTFTEDGYILSADTGSSEEGTTASQYRFAGGTTYKENYDNTKVSFKCTDGETVSAPKTSFVHFQNGNMYALTVSMLLDADDLGGNTIYSLEKGTEIQKTGTGFAMNNAGELISLKNFIWKVSSSQYMVVSDSIKLVVSEKESLAFEEYVEILYDEGIVYLINEAGSYPTISSDCYLELENDVRIYLGSKNVSEGEEYKMNLTSILVSSEDGTELIPDEDYNIEVIDNPYVVVNVSDGEDGTSGDNGDEGLGGTQGNGGKAGTQGSQGSSGTSAENSNISYIPDTMPIFEATLTPKSYGVASTMKVNSNNTTISKATVIIKNSATGAEVYSKDITDDLNESSAFAGPQIDCLEQNTEYTYLIQSTYQTGTSTDSVTQVVLSKVFYTSSLGVTLQHKYSTVSSIVADVVRTTADGADKIRIKVYNENMVFVDYASPVDPTGLNYQDSGADLGKFDIPETVAVGDTIPVKLEGLDSNKIYYFQVEVLHLAGDTQIIPNGAFPYERFSTLKKTPLLGKPSVVLSEQTRSFLISSVVNDYDNGITGYRYEVYTTDGYNNGDDPVTTINKDSLTDYSLLIDGSTIKRETYYCLQIVAIFNDNYTTTEYRSPISDPMFAGESNWPTLTQIPTKMQITASTAEGVISISDPSNTIEDWGSGDWSMKVIIAPTAAIGDGEVSRHTQSFIVDQDTFTAGRTVNGSVYQIPYAFKSLKSEWNYTITVYAHSMVVNGLDLGGVNGVIVGTTTVTTGSYETLYIRSINDSMNLDKFFHIWAILSPASETVEAQKESKLSNVNRLTNLGDFSGRSMTTIVLELYAQNSNGTGPDLSSKLGNSFTVRDEKDRDPEDYGVTVINGSNYADLYDFDSSLFTTAYKRSAEGGLTNYALDISEENFGITTSEMSNYTHSYVYLKVSTIYDYTYGTGGTGYPIYGDRCNTITCGDSQDYIDNDVTNQDCWIEIELNVQEPNFPTAPYFNDAYAPLTKAEAEGKKDGVVTYYSNVNNYNNLFNSVNYTADPNNIGTLLANLTAADSWTKIKNGTNVGIEIAGLGALARSCQKVRYYVYKYNTTTKAYDLANESGWLPVTSEVALPTYTYFLNVEDATTHISIARGDKIKVKMEIELTKVFVDNQGTHMIWPTNSKNPEIAAKEISATFNFNKEMPTIRMIPYMANANNAGAADQYYFIANDPDKAFEYNGNDQIKFYKSGSDTALNTNYVVSGNMNLLTISGTVPHDVRLVAKYKQLNSESLYLELPLVSEEKIYGDKSIAMVNNADFPFEITAGTANMFLTVYFTGSSKENLIAADVEFSKSGYETVVARDCELTFVGDTTKDDVIYYEYKITVPLTKVISLAGQGGVSVKAICYYDSGLYGVGYVTGTHTLEYTDKDAQGVSYMTTTPGQKKYVYQPSTFDAATDIDIAEALVTVDGYEQTFDGSGISVIPKKLTGLELTYGSAIAIPPIDPNVVCTVTTGYSAAKTDVYVTPGNSLNKTDGLKFWYRETALGGAYTCIVLPMNNGEYHWNKLISGLKPDTTYDYYIEGNQLTNSVYAWKTFTSGSFKTKQHIIADYYDFEFVAESTSRNSKYAQATFEISNVLHTDLVNAVDTVTFYLYENDMSSTPIATQTISGTELAALMSDACKAPGSTVTGTIKHSVQFNWAPSEEHEMNGTKIYYSKFVLNYIGSAQTEDGNLSTIPVAWTTGSDLGFTIIPSTGTIKDSATTFNFWINFNVSGVDYKRLIAEVRQGKTRYVAELHKVIGGTDTVVEYQNANRIAFDVLNVDGSITPNTIVYNYLEPNTEYYLKIYAAVDTANTGILALATTDPLDDVFSISSTHIMTPESSDIKVNSFTMIPALTQINVDGENLEYTKKIMYVLTDKTTKQQTTVTLVENGTGAQNITSYFSIDMSSGSVNKYILSVPAMKDATHDYTIRAYFYKDVNASTASCIFNATYTYTPPETTSKIAGFFKTKLFSIFANND